MPYFCADKIASALNEHEKAVRGSRVAIIGVSYKPRVGDLRESRVLKILRDRGAELVYHDAHVEELPDFDLKSASLEQVLEGANTAATLTAHPGLDVERILATAPLVVDFRGVTRGVEAPQSRPVVARVRRRDGPRRDGDRGKIHGRARAGASAPLRMSRRAPSP